MDAVFNVVTMNAKSGQQRFLGHGLPKEGMSEAQLCNHLAECFNRTPDHYSCIPALLKQQADLLLQQRKSHDWKDKQVDVRAVKGYDPGSPQDFCLQLIYDLVKAPLEAVSMDFVKMHPNSTKDTSWVRVSDAKPIA